MQENDKQYEESTRPNNPTPPSKSFISRRIRSFSYAIRGVWCILRTQHNAWIHAVATIVVILAGIFLRVSVSEWYFLITAIVAVWIAEGLNTALEILADAATPDFHPLVGRAKEVAAGAVLIAAIGAAIIGSIIFIPKIVALITY